MEIHFRLLVVVVLLLCSTGGTLAGTASVCFLFYGLPNNVDYPWGASLHLAITYYETPQTNSHGTYQPFYGAIANYTYTNKVGASTSHIATLGSVGNIYLNSTIPVDVSGIQFELYDVPTVQLPGVGPLTLYSEISISNSTSNSVLFGDASRLDTSGQAWASDLPYFVGRGIGASNRNALAYDLINCRAPITFTNGLRPPIQPSAANGAANFSYTYTITDGATYSVTTSLIVHTSSAFATTQDLLGNPYQTITGVSGTRVYSYMGVGSLTSVVTGLSTALGTPSQRWYPYSLLQSSPGTYTTNTAPFVDGNGIGFSISPAAPVNGRQIGVGPQYTDITLLISGSVLTEFNNIALPRTDLQTQNYTFITTP